jgi:N-acetylglucosaminyl-diphospho-decaprenol L-rhamnosyltransferase
LSIEVSAIVVNHRSAGEASACAASLRNGFDREGVTGEIVLVDCGSGSEEIDNLRGAPADLLLALAENRGYSGGVNAGLARASGRILLLCNADVVFTAGAISALREAVGERRVGAAGPLCFWDAGGRLQLPPGFAPGFARDFLQLATGRFPGLDRRRFRAFARQTLRLWAQGGEAPHLAGAVLAIRREVLDRVGRLDERFPFEYEETEWQDRARHKGYRLAYVPEARVRHLYARSAARNPETARRRAASETLYRSRRYGALGARLLARARSMARATAAQAIRQPCIERRAGACLALSTNPSVMPFAGAALEEEFVLPAEIRPSLAGGPLYLRVFRRSDGEPLTTFVWTPPECG